MLAEGELVQNIADEIRAIPSHDELLRSTPDSAS